MTTAGTRPGKKKGQQVQNFNTRKEEKNVVFINQREESLIYIKALNIIKKKKY